MTKSFRNFLAGLLVLVCLVSPLSARAYTSEDLVSIIASIKQLIIDLGQILASIPPESMTAQVLNTGKNNLVGYWNFNEDSGTIAHDSSGNNFDGNLSGATWTTGKLGGGIQLAGSPQYVNVPYNISLDLPNSGGSISVWFKPGNTPVSNTLVHKRFDGNIANTYGIRLLFYGGGGCNKPAFVVGTQAPSTTLLISTTPCITVGNWYHLVGTWDQNTLYLYLNGSLMGSQQRVDTLSWGTNHQPLEIGRQSYAGSAQGIIDEVRLYNRTLSAQEVSSLYNDSGDVSSLSPPPQISNPTISSFSSSPSSITSGQATTLSWSVTDATSLSINNGVGNVTGLTSKNVSPTISTTYTLTATNSVGSITKSIMVTVTPVAPPPPSPSINIGADLQNKIVITEKSGLTTNNYPIQFARPFVQGEITNYPQVLINGVPVLTQADVKLRYPDGSVKHSIISFLIPTFQANSSITITFRNQSTGNNTPLTKEEMLANNFNFDAIMDLTNGGVTKTASAKTMLQNGDYTYWTSGPIATTIILADHSANRRYDIGFDSYRPFRPIFHATFWPTINKVHVRYIGETANTEELEDMSYSLTLKLGGGYSQTVYTKPTFTQYGASRWTKDYWLNGTPTTLKIDHNLPYLIATKFIPNYDTSKIIPESAISSEYSSWSNSSKDIFGAGNWQKAMPSAGGRSDIGPYPTWTVQWLYTFDDRLKEKAFGNADLAAAWGVHLREGKPGKFFDIERTTLAIGKPISIKARPFLFFYQGLTTGATWPSTPADARIKIVGSLAGGGWQPDGAHQPDPFSPQYTVTGDYFYLEEMQFWAAWSAARVPGGSSGGPTGTEGIISDEVRGEGWVFRSRAETAFLSPDNTPEKKYFTGLINEAIATWEGYRNITGTQFSGNSLWNWAYSKVTHSVSSGGLGIPPLHNWEGVSTGQVQETIDPAEAYSATSPWMQNFLIYGLGRAQELGYPTDTLLSWVGSNLIGQLTDPDYNPYLSGSYRMPTAKKDPRRWYQSWAETMTGFLDSAVTVSGFNTTSVNDVQHGYPYIALSATSMVANQPGGAQAWNWISGKLLGNPLLNANPKWALVPRSISTIILPPSVPIVFSFTANPSTINPGSSSVLSWDISGATSISINQNFGVVTGSSRSVTPAQTTNYIIIASNSAGTATKSVTVTVNTNAVDITPPTVSLTAPVSNSTLSGVITLSATASDNVAIQSVQFMVDGVNIGNPDAISPYSIQWDSSSVQNGSHIIKAITKDTSGNQTTSSLVSITISAPSTSDTTRPSVPTNLVAFNITSTSVTLTWSSSTDPTVAGQTTSGVAGYKIYKNSTQVATVSSGVSYIDTSLDPSTSYSYGVATFDKAGNTSAQSSSQNVSTSVATVTPTPPQGGVGGTSYTPTPTITNPSTLISVTSNTPTSTISPSTPSPLTRSLYRTLTGSDVSVLQTFLIAKGYLAPENVSGFYGPLTEQAVKDFQSQAGIITSGTPVTTGYGTVGPKTKSAINALLPTISASLPQTTNITTTTTFTRNLSLGSTGLDVRALQIFLQSKGYLPSTLVPTTLFGQMTQAALVKYQKASGISPTSGFFGPITRMKISK